jgi:hypothetical protein
MRTAERLAWLAVVVALGTALYGARRDDAQSGGRGGSAAPTVAARPPAPLGVRLSMAGLHAQGGVPLGWQPTLPPGDPGAGRRTFEALGCPACHHGAGETFANDVPEPRGPELTGMGSHHPSAYFAEAILNPDAVRIEGPGYLDDAGRSTMPAYDTMTI